MILIALCALVALFLVGCKLAEPARKIDYVHCASRKPKTPGVIAWLNPKPKRCAH